MKENIKKNKKVNRKKQQSELKSALLGQRVTVSLEELASGPDLSAQESIKEADSFSESQFQTSFQSESVTKEPESMVSQSDSIKNLEASTSGTIADNTSPREKPQEPLQIYEPKTTKKQLYSGRVDEARLYEMRDRMQPQSQQTFQEQRMDVDMEDFDQLKRMNIEREEMGHEYEVFQARPIDDRPERGLPFTKTERDYIHPMKKWKPIT
jgi:hypothetical protein